MPNVLHEIAAIAESQLGASEAPHGSNRGAALRKYFAADNYAPNPWDEGYPWCAAFVDWVLQEWMGRHPEYARGGYKRPRNPDAFGFTGWGREQGCQVFHPHMGDPDRGDIVVYTFSHCGIVADVDLRAGTFHAIEGNSNNDGSREGYAVVRHARNFASVHSFVRLPVIGQEVRAS